MIPDPDVDDSAATPERPRWDPIGGAESTRAYLAFATYRDLGMLRSLRKAAAAFYQAPEPTEPQVKQFKRWSSEHGWVQRADAWDLHLDEVARTQQILDVKAMNTRQAQAGRNLQAIGGLVLTGDGKDQKPATLTIPQALKALELGAKLERTARGQPDVIAVTVPDDGQDQAMEAKQQRALAAIDEVRAARERRAAEG